MVPGDIQLVGGAGLWVGRLPPITLLCTMWERGMVRTGPDLFGFMFFAMTVTWPTALWMQSYMAGGCGSGTGGGATCKVKLEEQHVGRANPGLLRGPR